MSEERDCLDCEHGIPAESARWMAECLWRPEQPRARWCEGWRLEDVPRSMARECPTFKVALRRPPHVQEEIDNARQDDGEEPSDQLLLDIPPYLRRGDD